MATSEYSTDCEAAVLEFLKTGQPLSGRLAVVECGVVNLHSVIMRLRQDGYYIEPTPDGYLLRDQPLFEGDQ